MMDIRITYLEKLIHEMNTPLGNIYLLSDLMLNDNGRFSEKDKKSSLQHIHDSSKKISKIVSLLSTITNLKHNKVALHLEGLDLVDLIKQEVKYHETTAVAKPNLKIFFNSSVENCISKVDEFWFKQLLANLIINAINHTKEGKIEIVLKIVNDNDQNYFSLAVKDEGTGIPKNELDSIFLPLTRGSHSIGKVKGSGIGLAVVKEVAEAHGGKISVKNNKNKGSIFEIIIPLIS